MQVPDRLKKWSATSFIALAGLMSASATYAATWTLTGNLVTHDPGIIKENIWWIGETSTAGGIAIKYSPDGKAWSQGIPIFGGGLSWWKNYNGGNASTWAPDISRFNGKTNVFYSVSTFGSTKSAIGLAQASSMAAGDWVDKGIILSSNAGASVNAIDPSFVTSTSGTPYLTYGSWGNGIYITKLDSSTLKPTGNAYRIATVSGGGIEGGNIVYNGGYYYLFASRDRCCAGANSNYKIVYGRSTSITGPYIDKTGVDMKNGGGTWFETSDSGWAGSGGQSVANGVIARHRYARSNGASILFISDLRFSNGWPSF
ncbi:MAG: family 43 glycosylhydrolase [Cellvibrio sp.]